MPLRFLFNHNVHGAIARGLVQRAVDVLTARADGSHRLADPDLMSRATELDRVLFTHDDDLLREAHLRRAHGVDFTGLVYVHQNGLALGRVIDDLELLAEASEPEELLNEVVFLPLK